MEEVVLGSGGIRYSMEKFTRCLLLKFFIMKAKKEIHTAHYVYYGDT